MGSKTESPAPRRLIDTAAQARFLAALRAGAAREVAAAEAGFPLKSLYNIRCRDPLFRLSWTWAMELSGEDQRRARVAAAFGGADDAPVRVAPQGGRLLQRRRMRWLRFTEARQQMFLDHFAGTADAGAAAEAAGVSYATVSMHRRRNPAFAARWDEALQIAYVRLEAEALRQRLAEQERLRDEIVPAGEVTREFDRMMQLFARWDRRGGAIGPREIRPGRQKTTTFDEAIQSLHKRLRNLGVDPLRPSSKPDGGS